MRTIACLLLSVFPLLLHANSIDSLKNILQSTGLSFEQKKESLEALTIAHLGINIDSSFLYNKELELLAKQYNDNDLLASALNYKANLLLLIGKPDSTITVAELALEITDVHKLTRVKSYIMLSQAERIRHQFQSALSYLAQAKMITPNDNSEYLYKILLIESQIYNEMGDESNQYRCIILSIKYLEELEKTNENLLLQIGRMYEFLNDYEKALYYNKQALLTVKPIKRWYIYMRITNYYANLNHYDSVHLTFREAMNFHERAKINTAIGYLYAMESEAFLAEGKIKEAYKMAKTGVQISKSQGELKEEMDSFYSLAKVLVAQGNYKEAMNCIIDVENRLSPHTKFKALKIQVYAKLNRWEEAYHTLQKYHHAIDSSFNKDSILQVNSELLQLQFEREKELLKELNQQKLDIAEAQISAERNIRWGLMLFIALLTNILALLYRNHKAKEKANYMLQQRREELLSSNKKLAESNYINNRILYTIGHDLRSPISGFNLVLNTFLKGQMPQNQFINLLPSIKQNISTVFITLNNLLYWGLLQTKETNPKPQVIHLRDAVEQVKDFLIIPLLQKEIRFMNNIEEDLLAELDTNQLDLVFRNLLNNSIKFTPQSGVIKVNARLQDSTIKVEIQDSGIGISEERQAVLFKKMDSTSGLSGEKGTGLGLMLCKDFVESWGGQIWVNSVINRGSTFSFSIPRV